MDNSSDFNAAEQKVIRYLHRQYVAGDLFFSPERVRNDTGLTPEQTVHVVSRLEALGIMVPMCDDGTAEISRKICDVVAALNRPPDYWKKLRAWWFSRWWSIPITVLAVVVPALLQWRDWLSWIWSWFRPGP